MLLALVVVVPLLEVGAIAAGAPLGLALGAVALPRNRHRQNLPAIGAFLHAVSIQDPLKIIKGYA